MTDEVVGVVYRIITLGLLGFIGFIVGRKKYLPEESGKVLSAVVVKLTMPFLIITTLTKRQFTLEELRDGAFIYGFGLIFLLMALGASYLVSKRMPLQEQAKNIYRMQSMFGNVVFLAFPLLEVVDPKRGLISGVFFYLANDTVLWTIGIYLLNKHKNIQWKDNLKHLINGNTIAFALGIICVAIDFQSILKVYPFVSKGYNLFYNAFSPLGNTTIYLSMMFIGIILSEVKIESFKSLLGRYPIIILSVCKLLIIPFIAYGILLLFGDLINPIVRKIVVLQLAMPCGTIVPAMAAQYGSDYKFATETAFISTVISIATLPVMVYFIT